MRLHNCLLSNIAPSVKLSYVADDKKKNTLHLSQRFWEKISRHLRQDTWTVFKKKKERKRGQHGSKKNVFHINKRVVRYGHEQYAETLH